MARRKANIAELAQYFNENFSHVYYDVLQHSKTSDKIISDAAKHLFVNDDKNNRNLVCQILKRNTGDIKALLTNKDTLIDIPVEPSKKIKFLLATKKALRELRICRSDVFQSYYHCSSVYSDLCIKLGLQNTQSNRKKLNMYCTRKVNILFDKKSKPQEKIRQCGILNLRSSTPLSKYDDIKKHLFDSDISAIAESEQDARSFLGSEKDENCKFAVHEWKSNRSNNCVTLDSLSDSEDDFE